MGTFPSFLKFSPPFLFISLLSAEKHPLPESWPGFGQIVEGLHTKHWPERLKHNLISFKHNN